MNLKRKALQIFSLLFISMPIALAWIGFSHCQKHVRSHIMRSMNKKIKKTVPLSFLAGTISNSPDISQIFVKNTQIKFVIDKQKVQKIASRIQNILNVGEFGVDIWFCSDQKIRALNSEWLGKDKSTDILSFPSYEFASPGVFADEGISDVEKHLGDLVLSPAFIQRQCDRDRLMHQEGDLEECLEDDLGVSRAMAMKFTVEERIPLLLVHGYLHLLGYDHEEDADWRLMGDREDEVMAQLEAHTPSDEAP